MKSLLLFAAAGLLTTPAIAAPELLPVRGVQYATYDLATGTTCPLPAPSRFGDPRWSAIERPSYFYRIPPDYHLVLDWGDIQGPQGVGAFEFAYATAALLPSRLEANLMFFAEENGRNSSGRVWLAGFRLSDLPTADPGGSFNSWVIGIDLTATGNHFTINGSDLDFDGLVDFGYSYTFPESGDPTGPVVAGDPNLEGPGMENAFDAFARSSDPNAGSLGDYFGTLWFDGHPFAQFYLGLFESNCCPPDSCPNPGASGKYCTADVACGQYPCDCIVGLDDLAYCLAGYPDPDAGPCDFDGDGDFDLADLAELLSQYGDDCN